MSPLTKLFVALPNHWAGHRTETLWARSVGVDLHRLSSIPFFAYGLAYGDVVRADPFVREVVRAGGHTTIRVVFRHDDEPRDRRIEILSELAPLRVSFEEWDDTFFALDVAKGGDVDAVIDRLEWLEKRDVLGFETCEARVRGSFDHEDHSARRAG